MINKIKKAYKGPWNIFGRYWKYYGGFGALVRSPYLHVSFILTILTYRIWTEPCWWDMTLNIMPNVLGFSLGGYAIWLAIGDEKFKSVLAGSGQSKISPFLDVNATFVHFILMQILSILLAILAKGFSPIHDVNILSQAWWGFGFFVFIYALLTAVAATMAVFRVATWYDSYQSRKNEIQHKSSNDDA